MAKTLIEKVGPELKKLYKVSEEYIKHPYKFDELLKTLKSREKFLDSITKQMKELPLLVEMAKDYYNKKYTEIPVKTIVVVIATIIYISNPLDIIPDIIPVAGVMDDVAAVSFCLKLINDDFNKYKQWKTNQNVVAEQ